MNFGSVYSAVYNNNNSNKNEFLDPVKTDGSWEEGVVSLHDYAFNVYNSNVTELLFVLAVVFVFKQNNNWSGNDNITLRYHCV